MTFKPNYIDLFTPFDLNMQKVHAIKAIREATGCGLWQAKEIVEFYMNRMWCESNLGGKVFPNSVTPHAILHAWWKYYQKFEAQIDEIKNAVNGSVDALAGAKLHDTLMKEIQRLGVTHWTMDKILAELKWADETGDKECSYD